MAVPHYTYLVLKMPGPRGIITVKGSFELSDLCDKEFHKIAQNFGMIANYGQPKDKINKHDDEATRRTPSRARGKETVSTTTESKGSYNGGGEDFYNIDNKHTKSC
jgi:hypothetical protein